MAWRIYSADKDDYHWLHDDDGSIIAKGEDRQRIQLLGTAPQMLEALCSIRDKVECYAQPLLPESVAGERWEAVRKLAVAAIAATKGDE